MIRRKGRRRGIKRRRKRNREKETRKGRMQRKRRRGWRDDGEALPCSPSRCHSAEGSSLKCVCPRWHKVEVQPPGVPGVPLCSSFSQRAFFLPTGEVEKSLRTSECPTLVLRNIGAAGLSDKHLNLTWIHFNVGWLIFVTPNED